MRMKIRDWRKGPGIGLEPMGVEPSFRRGDTFIPVDHEHSQCGRTLVVGVGVKVWKEDGGHAAREALLMRCLGCLKSYTL